MNATTTSTLISDMITEIGSTLVGLLPDIFLLVASLIALFFGVRIVKKYIGKGK